MVERVEAKKKAAELLPFYLNDTLSDEERSEVEAVLAEDEGLRQELALLSHIRDEIKADAPKFSPGELGLARLTRAIGDRKAPVRRRELGVMVASFGAAILAIGSIFYISTEDGDPRFVQAGAGANARVLVVAFQPSARQREISQLLLAHDITIIDGPSAIGLYRIAVPSEREPGEILAVLRAATAIVESADSPE